MGECRRLSERYECSVYQLNAIQTSFTGTIHLQNRMNKLYMQGLTPQKRQFFYS